MAFVPCNFARLTSRLSRSPRPEKEQVEKLCRLATAYPALFKFRDRFNATPADVAARLASPTLFREFVTLRLVNPKTIVYASSSKSLAMLLADGADPNVEAEGATPLASYALSGTDARGLRLLLEAGADYSKATYRGCTPFLAVAGNNYLDGKETARALAILLKHGASVKECDAKGRSGLFLAIYTGHPTKAPAFLNVGVNPLLKDNEGNDALHIACGRLEFLQENAAIDLVRRLLKAGCDPETPNAHGMTARQILQSSLPNPIVSKVMKLLEDMHRRPPPFKNQ